MFYIILYYIFTNSNGIINPEEILDDSSEQLVPYHAAVSRKVSFYKSSLLKFY